MNRKPKKAIEVLAILAGILFFGLLALFISLGIISTLIPSFEPWFYAAGEVFVFVILIFVISLFSFLCIFSYVKKGETWTALLFGLLGLVFIAMFLLALKYNWDIIIPIPDGILAGIIIIGFFALIPIVIMESRARTHISSSENLKWCPECEKEVDWENWDGLVGIVASGAMEAGFTFDVTLVCKHCRYEKLVKLPKDIPAILKADASAQGKPLKK